jgi:AraC-like DNA-binding protein
MIKRSRPAVDPALAPLGGVSRDGQPLSYNRAPQPELAPWLAGLYVTQVRAPEGHCLDCGLFNETSFLRIQLAGEWSAETAAGPMARGRSALYLGPHTRLMPVSVTGSFTSVGVAFRPGAARVLKGPDIGEFVDRITVTDRIGMRSRYLLGLFEPGMTPEEMLQVLEVSFLKLIDRLGASKPDPITARFEAACFANPSISVAEFARDIGIEQRRLERVVRRDFGLAPKQVLRRSRALDAASHLLGLSDRQEAEDLALRYYDQSHLIREFVHFFGVTPSQFVARPRPILALSLESRQARRLEAIRRLSPGGVRPWQ